MEKSTTSSARFATPRESADWNRYILLNPDGGNILQGVEYADLKKENGWKTRHVFVGKVAVTILERHFFGIGHIWYIPKGPGVTNIQQLEETLRELKSFAKMHGVAVITLDPELPGDSESRDALRNFGLVPRHNIQANVITKLVAIQQPLDDVLATLPQKSRYAINRARRDGVTAMAVASTDENCKIMYDLMLETAGGRYEIYSYDYYKSYWQRYEEPGIGRLFFAYQDGRIVAGAYVLAFGSKGTYKDGGSVRDRSAYGASHLLQWTVIEWLKQKQVVIHDLCGAPPASESKNPNHRLYGIGLFKSSFTPETIEYAGTYDMFIRPIRGKLWHRYGERLANALSRRLFHRSYY